MEEQISQLRIVDSLEDEDQKSKLIQFKTLIKELKELE